MNINDAVVKTKLLFGAGQAAIWESPPGIGKSQVGLKLFEQYRAEGAKVGQTWGLGIIFAATQTPPDLIGYQFKGEREFPTHELDEGGKPVMRKITVTEPSVPLWMISTEGKPAFCYDRFFLIIEEYGQGEADVKRATAEIFLNGGTAPWYLPPGSVRLAMTNTDARDGVTKDFDFAIARRTRIRITPDVTAWLAFADKPYNHQGRTWHTMGVTKAWAAQNPQVLFEDKPKEQGPWCNPRQLMAADRYMQLSFDAQRATGAYTGEASSEDLDILEGTIGMPATTSFAAHMQFLTQLPSYEEVVKNPGTAAPDRADLKMLMAYQLASRTVPSDVAPVLKHIEQYPTDMQLTFVAALLNRDWNMMQVPAMQAWTSRNAAMVSVITSLS